MVTKKSMRIAHLNDAFRRKLSQGIGSVYIMQNLFDRGDEFVAKALTSALMFKRFNDRNDPLGRHEYGSIKIDGQPVFGG